MVSVVATVWNEAGSLQEFLRALLAQTLPADEIVISDGGSTDGTRELLQEVAHEEPRVHPILLPRSNRSVGRNAAIEAARNEIIAVTDAGSRADPDWLERITAPLRADPTVCMVGGYYRALARSPLQEAIAAATVVPPERVDPETFLPSSRSLAFRKEAWARVGGYPEWSDHNEDTIFALALRRAGCRMVFVPDAVVSWEPSPDLRRLFKQFYRYARGDAQAGLFFGHYWKNLAIPAAGAAYLLGRRHPRLRAAVGTGVGLYLAKQSLRALRQTRSAAATALTPAVALTLDMAHLTGYVHGILDRPAIRRAREDAPGE
ncbi:MAG TPA: glycosyltransferase [Armatimonadota bacterium]|jgi:glycosyltransferase involved in cell wall biosynthesis|nr:glycosyltransferase [Armatimonadota bacterium]HPO74164.1 glycosyltransferase [Armatimonadota bacterium]HPT98026.1 glycosyltransferase [Armatimonadota bacterium]